MPIPDFQTLMLPVLRLAAHGETRVPDLEELLGCRVDVVSERALKDRVRARILGEAVPL